MQMPCRAKWHQRKLLTNDIMLKNTTDKRQHYAEERYWQTILCLGTLLTNDIMLRNATDKRHYPEERYWQTILCLGSLLTNDSMLRLATDKRNYRVRSTTLWRKLWEMFLCWPVYVVDWVCCCSLLCEPSAIHHHRHCRWLSRFWCRWIRLNDGR